MSHPPKIDRKSLKTPDNFVKKGTAALGVLVLSRKRFVPVLIFMVLIVLGAYGKDWFDAGKTEKAWKAYSEAIKVAEPAKWEQLATVFNSYAKTRPMILAGSTLGDHFFDEAKKELLKEESAVPQSAIKAVEWYAKVLEFSDLIPGEKQLLLVNRASSFELLKKYDEALKDLKGASDLGGDIKGLALLNTARVLELKDDKIHALETYEKVSADFSTTEYAKIAKNHVRRLKSPLLSNQKF